MNKPAKKVAKDASKDQVARFEESLNELEQLVGRMESGEQSLDESLHSFERGITLFRDCQGALEQAELRVQTLLDPEHPERAEAFPGLTPPATRRPATAEPDDDDIPF